MLKSKKMKYKILTAIFAGFLFTFSFAHASTSVYFTTDPSQIKIQFDGAGNATTTKGGTFTIDLKISSDKSINTIDGTLIYDKNKLSVKEVNTDSSLFSIWANPPHFDNSKGTITFTGGVPNGFTGNDGQVFRIEFSAKSEGQAKVDFQDIFSVYLNDGLGTQISPWMTPIALSIIPTHTEMVVKQAVQILVNADKKNNHLLLGALVLAIAGIIILFIKKKKE